MDTAPVHQPSLPLSPPSAVGDMSDEDDAGAAKSAVASKPKDNRRATVAVKNLDPATTDGQLYSVMLQVGEVRLCKMHRKKDSLVAVILFTEEAAASLAIKTLNGTTLNGRVIQVCVL
jgi:RNA recognition motif-containing protein